MAFTLQQWVQRSLDIASGGQTYAHAKVFQGEVTAEALAHQVMIEVCTQFAGDPATGLAPTAQLVLETMTISMTNGLGAVPTRALIDFIPYATVEDPADATLGKKMRWLPWKDFIRPSLLTYGYFTVNAQTTLYLTRPGSSYTPGAGMTGSIALTIPCAVDMPSSETATILCARQVEIALVKALAEYLKPYIETK